MQPVLRPARMCDAKKIHGLLMECSAEGLLLPRSLSNLYGQIRDFRILETSGGEFIGCAALGMSRGSEPADDQTRANCPTDAPRRNR